MQASASFAASGFPLASLDLTGPARRSLHDQQRCASGLYFSVAAPIAVPGAARCAVKRGMDIVLALAGFLLLLPLFCVLAVLVRLTSRGPAFFVQQRPGRDGRLFPMLKFRTMHVHLEDRSGFVQTVKHDPRVTAFGAFLRHTSLDELPQLLNVLAGHMSLIGPRPHVTPMTAGGVEYEELVPYYRLRRSMRPGISGWAQVNGLRGPTTDAARAIARIDHDIAYIQNFSIWLDIRIILLTLWREFFGGSGY